MLELPYVSEYSFETMVGIEPMALLDMFSRASCVSWVSVDGNVPAMPTPTSDSPATWFGVAPLHVTPYQAFAHGSFDKLAYALHPPR